MRIAEIYKSIQGEGRFTGTESVFLRTSGCNLRCGFCDTPWTSWAPEGQSLSVPQIVGQCLAFKCDHVVLTGGEPMLSGDVVPLTTSLAAAGLHLTIETAGTVDQPVFCDLMSISPKLSNSTPGIERGGEWAERHEAARHCPDVIQRLLEDYDCQLKFVVDHPNDCNEVLEWLEAFPQVRPEQILLMPQGVEVAELNSREQWLKPWCVSRGFVYCPRMHIVWFGNQRGT